MHELTEWEEMMTRILETIGTGIRERERGQDSLGSLFLEAKSQLYHACVYIHVTVVVVYSII